MKHIVLDCLRRWAWVYIAGFILAVGMNFLAAFFLPFGVFTPYFLAPMLGPLFVLGFDLMRGAAGVTIALPVSARKVGVGYWIVGVCVPAVLLSLALVVATIVVWPFNPPIPSSWDQVASTFIISFLICGCIFFVLTFLKVGPQEGLWNNITAGLAGALWGLGAFAGIAVKYLLDFRKHDAVTMTSVVCVALVFTVLGFLRCDEAVRSRARNRIARQGSPRTSATATAETAPPVSGVSGFPYMFLESLKFTLGMTAVLIVTCGFLRFFLQVRSSPVFLYTLLFCALLPSMRYMPGVRHMRALPLSVNGLAFALFLLPLVNFCLCLALSLAVEALTASGIFKAAPAALLLGAAIASLISAMIVRFGPKFLPVVFVVGIMALRELPTDLLLASYAASTALMITAFAILRSSLRSSNLYRAPAGSFAAG